MTSIEDFFQPIIHVAIEEQKQTNAWINSTYEAIKLLEIDSRGAVGEALIETLLKNLKFDVERNNETDRTKKHWDIRDKTNNLDFEVKLATQGKKKNYQYEGFEKDRNYAGVILIAVAPNDLYITCAAKNKMPFVSSNNYYTKNNKTMHRRGHGIQYKWTLSQKDVEERKVQTIKDFRSHYSSMIKDVQRSLPKKK